SFGYYSLANNAVVDHEPAAGIFDLVFTKYMALVTQPYTAYYPVAGVFQNRTVNASQVDGVPTSSAVFSSSDLSTDINVIGYDWKNFNQISFQWEYVADRTYFVQDQSGSIWKLIFTSYGGGATGDFNFTQELVGQAGVAENGVASAVALFPNPASGGSTTLVVGNAAGNARMNVFDANGRLVMDEKLTGLSGLVQKSIDVSSLHAGMYTVRLQGERINTSARLVIE
ncbi:MAG TPA: T9SS type A sorting domain-containing protein, partial [Flavobacteriales bacterium]|nr:T9SS type A sorting domain-containing protein [Flavobacteriales bacterium]